MLCYLNEDYSLFILNNLLVLMFNGNDTVLKEKYTYITMLNFAVS